MIINKVINNNVLSTHDENNREIVLMGKGIGFQKKVGDEVAEDKIEKKFVLDSEDEVGKFSELIEMIPHNYLNLSVDIISYAQQVMPKRLSPSIYISLTDHINFLLERSTKGELFENPLFNEIKSFYPSEYLVGEKALELIESEAGIELPQDEAASIALHFVIAEYNMGMSDTVNATTMIRECISIVEKEFGLGDLTNFWGGKTSADVSWSLGMYMSGFFPCMMFGVPGAALAMLHCAKDNKKKVAAGLLLSAAICAFVCGVTEPFEFGFMFLAPVLYLIYAILYGIFTVITYYVGFRAGFSFSAGCTDLVFSSTLPAASKTWLIIPLGIAAFIVFYVVFRFAITKFDLKTPGREDDDVEAEKQAELGNNDYTQVASIILEGIGGKENVVEIDNCITRLRLEVKDNTIVDEKKIKSAGVAGVLRPGKNNVQVIIGTKVQFVADEFKKLCK